MAWMIGALGPWRSWVFAIVELSHHFFLVQVSNAKLQSKLLAALSETAWEIHAYCIPKYRCLCGLQIS